MTYEELQNRKSPDGLPSGHLIALWKEIHGDWDGAHRIVQVMDDNNAMWIHAWLHRKEPDASNADYWYRRCGKPHPRGEDFAQEARRILGELS